MNFFWELKIFLNTFYILLKWINLSLISSNSDYSKLHHFFLQKNLVKKKMIFLKIFLKVNFFIVISLINEKWEKY